MKVSIIVPVYNTRQYLSRCLNALVSQTLRDIEIILVDDGSTDGSTNILAAYKKWYPDLVSLYRKPNGGQGSARNLGLVHAKGEYVGFADSDDYVDATMYQAMYEAAVDASADLVECHYRFIEEDYQQGHRELKTRGSIREHPTQKDMFVDPQVSPWNKLFRREIFTKGNLRFPEGVIYEDTSLYIKAIPYIKKAVYIDRKFVYYFLHAASTMNGSRAVKVGDIFPVLEDILDYYKAHDFYRDYETELEYFCTKILLCSSLGRIGRIREGRLRRELIERSFSWIRTHFPDYKENIYYRNRPIGTYIRSINRANGELIGKVLGKVVKG